MNLQTRILGWVLAGIALFLWVGAGLFAQHINDMSTSREATIAAEQNATEVNTTSALIYSTALQTASQRALLNGFIVVDPVAVIKSLTATAQSIGVNVNITSAGTSNGTTDASQTGSDSSQLFGFSTDSQGKFSALMHAAQLFETLPAVSSIRSLDLVSMNPSGVVGTSTRMVNGNWRMNAQIQIVTSPTPAL